MSITNRSTSNTDIGRRLTFCLSFPFRIFGLCAGGFEEVDVDSPVTVFCPRREGLGEGTLDVSSIRL